MLRDILKKRKKKVDERGKKPIDPKQPKTDLSFEGAANALQKRRIEQQKIMDSL